VSLFDLIHEREILAVNKVMGGMIITSGRDFFDAICLLSSLNCRTKRMCIDDVDGWMSAYSQLDEDLTEIISLRSARDS
jgi:hypothetical protein